VAHRTSFLAAETWPHGLHTFSEGGIRQLLLDVHALRALVQPPCPFAEPALTSGFDGACAAIRALYQTPPTGEADVGTSVTGRRRSAAVRRAKDHGTDEATASAFAGTTLPPFEWFEAQAAGCLEALYGRAGLEAIWNPAEPAAAGSEAGGGSKAALVPKLKRLPSIADSSSAAVAAVARVTHGERAGTAPPPKEHTGPSPRRR